MSELVVHLYPEWSPPGSGFRFGHDSVIGKILSLPIGRVGADFDCSYALVMSSRHSSVSEAALREFLTGRACSLGDAVRITAERGAVIHYSIAPMDSEFEVKPQHLVRVCERFLEGEADAAQVQAVAFTILGSDWFHFDGRTTSGRIVSEVLNEWASPEINLPITRANMVLWQGMLLDKIARFQSPRPPRRSPDEPR